MTDLTEDERIVLTIAAKGQSMIAIARWEKPIDSLVAKGLMVRHDKHNNLITNAGREAIAEDEDKPYRDLLETGIKLRNAHEQARQSAEQAAQHLALAARASAATGNSPQYAAEQWAKVVLDRALELLNV